MPEIGADEIKAVMQDAPPPGEETPQIDSPGIDLLTLSPVAGPS